MFVKLSRETPCKVLRNLASKTHKINALEVNKAIRSIMISPKIGEEKKGDLSGVYVYKFKINQQQMLLAYEWNETQRLLLALGVHENFYRDLKRAL